MSLRLTPRLSLSVFRTSPCFLAPRRRLSLRSIVSSTSVLYLPNLSTEIVSSHTLFQLRPFDTFSHLALSTMDGNLLFWHVPCVILPSIAISTFLRLYLSQVDTCPVLLLLLLYHPSYLNISVFFLAAVILSVCSVFSRSYENRVPFPPCSCVF